MFSGGYYAGRGYTIIALSASRVVLGAAAVLRNANADVARNSMCDLFNKIQRQKGSQF